VASVGELSAPYANFMFSPRHGPGVCARCFNLIDGYDLCYACAQHEAVLDAMAPISYSVGNEQLHHALASYKRLTGDAATRLGVQLAAVLWRYLYVHERCIARAAGTEGFAMVTTVPSGETARDETHPLRRIVGELVGATRHRHEQLVRRSDAAVAPRTFDAGKYVATRRLAGEAVLLIDDTWTTGASAQSAAATLKAAGAGRVAAVVIGRHVSRHWHTNDARLRRLGFEWEHCALCAHSPRISSPSPQLIDVEATRP
jgi:hypothetical protein